MPRTKDSVLVQADAAQVYSLAHDPNLWPFWWEGMTGRTRVMGDGSPGTVVDYAYMLAGVSFGIHEEVVEEHGNLDGSLHCLDRFSGGIEGWRRLHFIPREEGGTKVVGELEYELPEERRRRSADRALLQIMAELALHESLDNLRRLADAADGAGDPYLF
jgi:hypothetical protein